MDEPTLTHYADVVRPVWPQLDHHDLTLVRAGDHDELRAGSVATFRFPLTEHALDELSRRGRLLDLLSSVADDLGVAVPGVIVRQDRDRRLGYSFVGTRVVPGEPLYRESVAALGPLAFRYAERVAGLLDGLAHVDTERLQPVLAPAPDPAALAAECRDRVLPLLAPLVRSRAAQQLDEMSALTPVGRSTFVHGRLRADALRWDPESTTITGVVDWDDAHVGDPALDLAHLATTFGWDFAATVDEMASESRLGRARCYAAVLPLWRALAEARRGEERARRVVEAAGEVGSDG